MKTVRRVMSDSLISGGSLLALLLVLVCVDDRVRQHVTSVVGLGPASSEVVSAGSTVRETGRVLLVAVQEQSIEHAPLVIFGLAATVLTLFMLRA